MTTFSWSDTIQAAFSSCLPCLSTPNPGLSSPSQDSLLGQDVNPNDPTVNRVRRARADELQGLLADTDTLDTDTEAERMSLHSNPGFGANRKRRTKKKKGKKITFFGYDLFGKPTPPIHLPDEDHLGITSHTRPRTQSQRSTLSSSTLDSDAAPLELDHATIARIPELELAQRAAQAIEAERLKQERRRERKEKKRIEKALALAQGNAEGEFEGFQGSGGDLPPVYSSQDQENQYGPFVRAPSRAPPHEVDEDAEADAPDFDGALYARKSLTGPSGSRSGSDSRSRTSASRSQPDTHDPNTSVSTRKQKSSSYSSSSKSKLKSNSSTTSSSPPPSIPSLSNPKSKSKSRSTTSGSSHASTVQSPSLASPSSASFPNPTSTLAPAVVEGNFDSTQGFGNRDPDAAPLPEFTKAHDGGFPSKGFSGGRGGFPSQGFPSSGLSTRFGTSGKAEMERDKKRKDSIHALGGALLATRGDGNVGVGEREAGL